MENKLIIRRLFCLLKVFRTRIIIISFTFLVMTLFSFFYPIIIKNLTDHGIVEKNLDLLIRFSLILLALLFLEKITILVQSYLCIALKNEFQASLFQRTFNKMLRLRLDYFEDKNSTELYNTLSIDVNSISILADNNIMSLLTYMLRIVSGSIGLFLIDIKLALVVFAVVPLKLLVVSRTSKKKEKYTMENIDKIRGFSSWFSDNINGIREIKLWNLYSKKNEQCSAKQQDLIIINKKNSMIDTYKTFCDSTLESSLFSVLYLLGGLMVYGDNLSVGGIIAFISYSTYVTGPITALLNMRFIFSSIVPSSKRLFNFLDLEEEEMNEVSTELNEFEGITFNNISYNYAESITLNAINLEIKRGEKIAIVGKNGSGKTTLIKLLLRFIEPKSGNIYINGKDISDFNLDEYRNMYSVVSQDVYLFHDSIYNNIDVQGSSSKKEVINACNKSFINDFIGTLPNGLDTMIGNNGTTLSGGERQKIVMARAIIKNSKIIVLDEATSNYDKESSVSLMDTLLRDFHDKTMIVVTHDSTHLDKMDKVYKLEGKMLYQVSIDGSVDTHQVSTL